MRDTFSALVLSGWIRHATKYVLFFGSSPASETIETLGPLSGLLSVLQVTWIKRGSSIGLRLLRKTCLWREPGSRFLVSGPVYVRCHGHLECLAAWPVNLTRIRLSPAFFSFFSPLCLQYTFSFGKACHLNFDRRTHVDSGFD